MKTCTLQALIRQGIEVPKLIQLRNYLSQLKSKERQRLSEVGTEEPFVEGFDEVYDDDKEQGDDQEKSSAEPVELKYTPPTTE